MFGLILIGCWIVLLIAAAFIISKYRRRRLRTVDERAQELGFSFDDNSSPFDGSEVRGLSVLRCDPSAIVSRMMTGKIGASPAVIFNLICYGQHCQSVNAVTIAAFRSPTGRLPLFRIGAKDVLQGLKTRIAGPDANGETECEFGKRCLLQCAAKDNARDFLTPRKLSELEGYAKNLCIESSADWVFAYRPCTCLKLEAWPEFIREIRSIAGVLFGEGSESPMQNKAHAAAVGA
ncbi:MAG: hypothetical protein ABSD96_02955 [Candidatus Korobacteraceae bacterium]|jgi:hypothetical protein